MSNKIFNEHNRSAYPLLAERAGRGYAVYVWQIPEAIIKRHTAYSIAAKEGYLVAAAHISFPGIGRVRATGKNYRWVSANYSIVSAE